MLAVYQAAKEARDLALAGEGPTLLETVTFRMGPHSSSDDPTKYRDESEAKTWEARDPLVRHRKWLTAEGLWDRKHEEDFLAEAGRTITEAIARVESSDAVPVESLFEDVWAEVPPLLVDQRERLLGDEPV